MTEKSFDDLPPFAREALVGAAPERELRETAEALATITTLAKPEPSEKGRARLIASVSKGPERYGPFFSKLSRMVDLGLEKVQGIFVDAENPQTWQPGPLPGVTLYHFTGGPAAAHADTGLVRLNPGLVFPEHKHLGREVVLLLEGAYRESTGRIYRAGDFHEMAQGTTHGFTILDKPCLLVTMLDDGIEIGGVKISG
jgi:putative transcriptional regulator